MIAREFTARWELIKRRGRPFGASAARLGLVTTWGEGCPFDSAAAPPAGEADVRAVEHAIGRPVPPSLRQFFREASAKIEFGWRLPSRTVEMPLGYTDVIFDLIPPPPFQHPRNMGGLPNLQPMSPCIYGGGLSIALDELASLLESARRWERHFADAAADEDDDEALRLHYLGFRDMWRRIFPIAEVGNGDQIGIDTGHPEAHVIVTNHEGADYPAWSLGRPLLEQLEQASRLGFIGLFGYNPFHHNRLFADTGRNRALEAAGDAERTHEAATLGVLRRIEAIAIDADSANGHLWRAWLGLRDGYDA